MRAGVKSCLDKDGGRGAGLDDFRGAGFDRGWTVALIDRLDVLIRRVTSEKNVFEFEFERFVRAVDDRYFERALHGLCIPLNVGLRRLLHFNSHWVGFGAGRRGWCRCRCLYGTGRGRGRHGDLSTGPGRGGQRYGEDYEGGERAPRARGAAAGHGCLAGLSVVLLFQDHQNWWRGVAMKAGRCAPPGFLPL